MEDVWQTYAELISTQMYFRHTANRVVSEGCKIAFTKKYTAADRKTLEDTYFKEGGICYVK